MSYIQQFEAELVAKLESGSEDTANIVRWVSEKVLESYRNGITAGQKGAQVKRQGASRRRGYFGKGRIVESALVISQHDHHDSFQPASIGRQAEVSARRSGDDRKRHADAP